MEGRKRFNTTAVAAIGGVFVILIMALGTFWSGQSAQKDTREAARAVSLMYLEELAGRREQVVEDNLKENISKIRIAVGLNAHLSKPVEPEDIYETLESLIPEKAEGEPDGDTSC